jgi:hypothetical protein
VSSNNRSTTNLLRRYLNGAITAPEEAELERRAQTDEPLAEAMRGLQSAPEEDHTARVSRMLDAARQQGQTGAKVVRARPNRFRWAAAAAVLLLVASSLFMLPSLLDPNVGDLAMESAPQPEPTSAASDQPQLTPADLPKTTPEDDTEAGTPSPAPSSSAPDPRPRPEDELKEPPKPGTTARAEEQQATARDQATAKKQREAVQKAAQRPPPPPPPAFEAEVVEEVMADESVALGVQRTPPPAPSPTVATAPAAAPASTAGSRARAINKDDQPEADDAPASYAQAGSPAGAYLDGRITNENGYPILNALVRLPGLPLGERTDSNGIFQFPADAAATALDISHPDYESERVNLTNPLEKLQISLERKAFVADDNRPSWQQNGASTRIVLDKKNSYASPLEGYSVLRQRIEANKPAHVSKGKVKLSFLVNPDGTLTDIQFRGKPDQATMDYIGQTLVRTSVWEVVEGNEPVRVYFKVVFE